MPCEAVNQIDGYAGQLSPSMFSAIGQGCNSPASRPTRLYQHIQPDKSEVVYSQRVQRVIKKKKKALDRLKFYGRIDDIRDRGEAPRQLRSP